MLCLLPRHPATTAELCCVGDPVVKRDGPPQPWYKLLCAPATACRLAEPRQLAVGATVAD